MTKPIQSYPENMRDRVAQRRSKCVGLGGLSAEAYKMRKGEKQLKAYAEQVQRDLESKKS